MTRIATSLVVLLAGTTPSWAQVTGEGAAEPAEISAEPLSGYNGGFFIHSSDGKFGMKLGARVQGRYELESVDEGGSRDEESAFSIARARIKISGHAFSEDIKYTFQADLGKGDVVLKDFIVDTRLGGPVWFRAGQFKRPFSRQQITSSGNLELVDRAITDKAFGGSRDIGIAVHNNYEKSPQLEWVVGVFNGSGDKAALSGDVVVDPATGEGEIMGGGFSNVPTLLQPAIVARVGYNTGGLKGYSEVDFEGGPLRLGVGASVLSQLDAPDDDTSLDRAEVDFMAKVEGFATTGGVYVATVQDGSGAFDQSLDALGFHAQAGYLVNGRYQPVARFAMVAPDGADNNVMELTAGMSMYLHKHGFKWQADAGAQITETSGDSTNDILVRTQLQLAF